MPTVKTRHHSGDRPTPALLPDINQLYVNKDIIAAVMFEEQNGEYFINTVKIISKK